MNHCTAPHPGHAEKAESYLKEAGFLDHVIELKESTATVALAAEALGVEPGMIAKTMSFLQGEQPASFK